MTSLAVLVLGSSLMAMAGGEETLPDDPGEIGTVHQPQPRGRDAKLARKTQTREARLSQHRHAAINTFFGVTLELGSAMLHYLNGVWLIGTDLRLSSAGCNAPDNPCGGPPFLVMIPAGATTMGWIGAARLAESREANLRDSTVFWVGTGIELSAYVVGLAGAGQKGKTARLAWHTTFVSMAALGTILQVVGAFTGPTRAETEVVASRSSRAFPGCAPISGGFMCGIAMTGL
jgi:hypothetical protein